MDTKPFEQCSREELEGMLTDFAKNWLAHDGLWFQAVERQADMEIAIKLDTEAWERFTLIEARRIMKRHNIKEGSGLEGLKKASDDPLTPDTVEIGIIKKGTDFKKLDEAAIKKYLDKL